MGGLQMNVEERHNNLITLVISHEITPRCGAFNDHCEFDILYIYSESPFRIVYS